MNSVFGADDYEFIRNRIKEINQEKAPPQSVPDTRPTCEACKDAGGCNGMCMHCYGEMASLVSAYQKLFPRTWEDIILEAFFGKEGAEDE